MNDFILRPWHHDDLPQLTALWQEAFGDGPDYTENFFSLFLTPGSCIVAEADGKAVSAMYILPGPLLFPPAGRALPSAYLYALATAPDYRGRGIGAAVYRACVSAALERADAACVLPSEASLYPFYENAAGSRTVSSVREALIPRQDIPAGRAEDAAVISSGEYYLRRKAILRGHPYAVTPGEFYAWERFHIQRFGGGLISVDGDIAAVEMDGDTCRVLELLAPEGDWLDVMQAVAARFPAARYAIRTPLFWPGPGGERSFMMASTRPDISCPIPDDMWWGFTFD